MIASVDPSELSGKVYAPPSKSYTHRAVTIISLGPGGVVERPLLSADTRATISAVEAFGARVRALPGGLEIIGTDGQPQTPENVIDVLNSGTTLRFMSAVAALTQGAVLTGDASIRSRPNGPLLRALNQLGAIAISVRGNDRAPLVVLGRLKGGSSTLEGGVSSQFLSALLISCPLAQEDTSIDIIGQLKSRPYAEMTLDMLRQSGAVIQEDGPTFRISGGQKFSLRHFAVPGDFSSASYLLAGAALAGSRVMVKGLLPSRQGDSAIVDVLERMGARISWDRERGEISVERSELCGIEVDASLTPDLVPTIAVLGSLARGRTLIFNAEHVRHKETDRLQAMAQELTKMGAKIEERPDGLDILGGELKGARVSGHHDHRIVMALTVAGLVAGETIIEGAEAVEVSYPGFFQDMAGLGAGLKME